MAGWRDGGGADQLGARGRASRGDGGDCDRGGVTAARRAARTSYLRGEAQDGRAGRRRRGGSRDGVGERGAGAAAPSRRGARAGTVPSRGIGRGRGRKGRKTGTRGFFFVRGG